MTIAAGFRCSDGIVLCSDSQETIPDYVKTVGRKITTANYPSRGMRLALTGAGGGDMLDMVFQEIIGRSAAQESKTCREAWQIIADVVYETTMKHIMPFPKDERPWFQMLAAIQFKGEPVVLLRSSGTIVTAIDHYAFVGSVAFAHFVIGELDIRSLPVYVVRSLALYILMMVKKHDPNCGDDTDIACLFDDGTVEFPNSRYCSVTEKQVVGLYQAAHRVITQSFAHLENTPEDNHVAHLLEQLDEALAVFKKAQSEATDEKGRLIDKLKQGDQVIIPLPGSPMGGAK